VTDPVVAFSANQGRFLTAGVEGTHLKSGSKGGLTVWDGTTGKELRTLQGLPDRFVLAISPSGRHVLVGDWNVGKEGLLDAIVADRKGKLVLWDLETGAVAREFRGHRDAITSVAFSRDGAFACTASADWSVRCWRMPDGVATPQPKK
jgi:WD40 repeat protein